MRYSNILITGAAGFLGSFLAEYLIRRGYFVVGVDNFFRGKKEYVPKSCQFYRLDLTKKEDVNKLVEIIREYNIDTIFHYAAINGTKYFYKIPFEVLKNNIEMVKNIINVSEKAGNVRKIVYASSSEVYGEPHIVPTPEQHPIILEIDAKRDSYAASKAIGEFYIKLFSEVYGIKYLIVRIFNTYGPRMDTSEYGQVIPEFIRKLLLEDKFTIYGDGNQTRAFTYVEDHVRLVYKLFKKTNNKIVNVGSDKETKIIELAEILHKIVGKPFNPIFLPPLPNDRKRRCPDITLLRKLVNDEPKISLEEGLKKTIKWYAERWGMRINLDEKYRE